MAARGDVLVSKRRLGFAREGSRERFVVVQSDLVSPTLETVLVVPLDEELPLYAGDPLVVPVSAREAGASRRQCALPEHTNSARLDRFDGGAIGRIRAQTMRKLDTALRVLLDLR